MLDLFTALIAINGLRKIFSSTVRAFPRTWLYLHWLPTMITEFCLRRQILTALRALLKHEQLMATIRAEFSLLGNGMVTIRTFEDFLGLKGVGILQKLSKHRGHHKAEAHTPNLLLLQLVIQRPSLQPWQPSSARDDSDHQKYRAGSYHQSPSEPPEVE